MQRNKITKNDLCGNLPQTTLQIALFKIEMKLKMVRNEIKDGQIYCILNIDF